MNQPELRTARLVLRPFVAADAAAVVPLVSPREVAATLEAMPHPYPPDAAAPWIASHAAGAASGTDYTWAVTRLSDGVLLAAVRLQVLRAHRRGEMGYWVGLPFWGQGIMSEAAGRVLAHAFDDLDLHRVQAFSLPENGGSVRVLEKLGFRREGVLRDYVLKWGTCQDRAMYGLLRDEWAAAASLDGSDTSTS